MDYVYVTHINMQKICEVKYESHLKDWENWRCENSNRLSFQTDESRPGVFVVVAVV